MNSLRQKRTQLGRCSYHAGPFVSVTVHTDRGVCVSVYR